MLSSQMIFTIISVRSLLAVLNRRGKMPLFSAFLLISVTASALDLNTVNCGQRLIFHLPPSGFVFYNLHLSSIDSGWSLYLTAFDGIADIFVAFNRTPTFTDWDMEASAESGTDLATVEMGCLPLQCPIPSRAIATNTEVGWNLAVTARCCAAPVSVAIDLSCVSVGNSSNTTGSAALPASAFVVGASASPSAVACGDRINISLPFGDWAFIDLLLPDPTRGWELVFEAVAGDPDFYLAAGRLPGPTDWDLASFESDQLSVLGCSPEAEETEAAARDDGMFRTLASAACAAAAGSSWRLGVAAYCCETAVAEGFLLCDDFANASASSGSSSPRFDAGGGVTVIETTGAASGPQSNSSNLVENRTEAPITTKSADFTVQKTAVSQLTQPGPGSSSYEDSSPPPMTTPPPAAFSTPPAATSVATRAPVGCGDEFNVTVGYGEWAFFNLTMPDPADGWELSFVAAAGDPDFYLAAGRSPGPDDWDLADFGTATDARLGCSSILEPTASACDGAPIGGMVCGLAAARAGEPWRLGVTAYGADGAAAIGRVLCINVSAAPTSADTSGDAISDTFTTPGDDGGATMPTSVRAPGPTVNMTSRASTGAANASAGEVPFVPKSVAYAAAGIGVVSLAAIAFAAHRLRAVFRRQPLDNNLAGLEDSGELPVGPQEPHFAELRMIAARMAAVASASEIAAGLQPPALPPRRRRQGTGISRIGSTATDISRIGSASTLPAARVEWGGSFTGPEVCGTPATTGPNVRIPYLV